MEVCVPYPSQNFWENSSTSEYQNGLSDEDEIKTINLSAKIYERSRIKALADERENVQKKTFTKWINSFLFHYGYRVNDLYVDLRDGKLLLYLLEILSNEVVPKPTRGRMRIHCLENVDKCLGFLFTQKVHLENVGAHDIVDGNPRLTLGLIWTIILRFQVQDIMLDEIVDSSVARSAKDALLLWCQMKTAGYPSVNIRNFTTSWRNGLGFLAIIHKHRPDLVDFSSCLHSDNIPNLQLAFSLADKQLGITALLDPEDVDVQLPDEKSIITYVASYYHYFNAMKASSVLNKRLNKLLNQVLEDDQLIVLYKRLVTNLLDWINNTINLLNMRQFANSISGVQQQMNSFNTYRTVEKPAKFTEKSDIEVLLFTIRSHMIGSQRKVYNPADDVSIAKINSAWDSLNTAEYEREMALRKELMRQEKLRNLAQRFLKKASLRESWITDNLELLSKQSLGNNFSTVSAALKKHEAIETDIYAYEENITGLSKIADNLEDEVYNDIVGILSVKNKVLTLWKRLLQTLHDHREYIDNHLQVYAMLSEFDDLQTLMEGISNRLKNVDYGKHLMAVEELLRQHELIDADIKVVNQRLEKLLGESDRYIRFVDKDYRGNSSENKELIVKKRLATIQDFNALLDISEERKEGLKQSQAAWQYIVDICLEEQWIKETLDIMKNPDYGNDLTSTDRILKKHKAVETEISAKRGDLENKLLDGKKLANEFPVGYDTIMSKNMHIQQLWDDLIDNAEARKLKLLELFNFYQFLSDCDDMDSWIDEFKRFFDLTHLGDRMVHTELLIKKNQQNMKFVEDRRENIEQLRSEADGLLGYTFVKPDDVNDRFSKVEKNYESLVQLSHRMQEKLLDELTVFRLLNDADSVRSWITEKEKFLVNFIPTDDIEELEVMKHRFEIFDSELTKRAEKVYHVNSLSENLVANGNPNYKVIINNQDNLNNTWNKMADVIDLKREELLQKYHFNTFFFECEQTVEWIKEKMQILESLEDTNNDLESLVKVQRCINHLHRDMCAIEAKIDYLDGQGELIIRSNFGSKKEIEGHLDIVHDNWNLLKKMIKEQETNLCGKSDTHRFLLDIEEFQIWLNEMQTEMASQTIPETLADAERMLMEFNGYRTDIEKQAVVLDNLLQIGHDYLNHMETGDQSELLLQRLNGLEKGWKTLIELTEEKERKLEQYMNVLSFFEDAKEIEKMLNVQESFLNKDVRSSMFDINSSKSNLLSLHEVVNDIDDFIRKMEIEVKVLSAVLETGRKLVSDNNFQKDKISAKCRSLEERWKKNLDIARQRKNDLKEQLILFDLLQDIDDLDDGLLEKLNLISEISLSSGKTKSNLYAQFKALEEEIYAHKPRFSELNELGLKMIKEYPKFKPEIDGRLENLNATWQEVTKALDNRLNNFKDSDRETIFQESTEHVMNWLQSVESQIVFDDESNDERTGLTAINNKLKTLDDKHQELQNKKKILEDLRNHSEILQQQFPEKADHYQQIESQVNFGLQNVSAPLNNQLNIINQQKEGEQFLHDCDEEMDWMNEKIDLIKNRSKQLHSICSLQDCQKLQGRHKSIGNEIENRKERIRNMIEMGSQFIQNSHPKQNLISEAVGNLKTKSKELSIEFDNFTDNLISQQSIQEYLLDVSEASSWLSEKELDLITLKLDKKEDNLIRKVVRRHQTLENEVKDYFSTVESLRKKCQTLPEAYSNVQENLERNYSALRRICDEKKIEISLFITYCDAYDLFQNLEQWIIAKTKIARSDESGRDLDQCSQLRERFTIFANENNKTGMTKVGSAIKRFDELIIGKHPFSHSICKWKDRINEIWADLLELIDTRIQLLKSAWDLHRWYCDCQLLLECIEEKSLSIQTMNNIGKEHNSVTILQRKLKAFEKDLSRLDSEINNTIAVSVNLLPLYSKDREAKLIQKRNELIEAFKNLRKLLEDRHLNNIELADYHNFLSMVRELINWSQAIHLQMDLKQKPRDVSGIELLLNNHRSLKTEMDSKEENFSICFNLGRTLLRTNHVKSSEIKVKCKELTHKRDELYDKWFNLLDHLSLMVEVYQWARDAALAEAWLVAQEAYIKTDNYGQTLEETLALLRKHVLFEKTYKNQEDKFEQLKRLTTLEIRAKQIQSYATSPKHAEVHETFLNLDTVDNTTLQKQDIPQNIQNFTVHQPKETSFRRSNSIDSLLDQESVKKESYRLIASSLRPTVSRPVNQQSSASPVPKVKDSDRPHPSNLGKPNMSVSSDALSASKAGSKTNRPEDVKIKGSLYRKHEWIARGQKASNRSWYSLFVEVVNSRLYFFKDERHYRERPGQFYKHEMPLILSDAVAAPAQDYTKRPCVFRLRFRIGAEYLFQASSIVDMNRWVDAINSATRVNPYYTTGNVVTTTQSHPDLSLTQIESTHPQQESGLKRFFSSIRLKK